jgi:cytochrome P450
MNKRPLPLLADPFPMYKALREQAPVHWDPSFECWILTRFRDVASVLTDPRFSADRSKSQHRFAKMMRHEQAEFGPFGRTATMINTDPPAHARGRVPSSGVNSVIALVPRILRLLLPVGPAPPAPARAA